MTAPAPRDSRDSHQTTRLHRMAGCVLLLAIGLFAAWFISVYSYGVHVDETGIAPEVRSVDVSLLAGAIVAALAVVALLVAAARPR